ncbi:hypothetical protein Dshi_4032 (plasmid) [Dinoroseobacter shibae DFL 12 = DSM 16493]|jgi:hypothetical protein|uniref:General secretion pathway protein K n=1 Tax=Dinoroseobacter shibae (strain DSM 16493 / NCIMB 14021 / DFL 12) TaxID=398580 RepID=A8LTB9_DINSH|nr:hypothetical protein [Dinoroseobacter shibae]ABV95486.1 hypothetical protein Dshi_3756 [Dinoroseobacter shibae DFL 12 = DSM 16493]ABV95759.1 hypothetical protein Dshi_4032 [Dinoroseobacter shibae DFL 12 = DSM 16493]URF48675.1 hypothetical protein M8008_19265 [Dinoroseobacter shibae]URF48973.1 hypothetical protein M8008_20675 [Dinoroseobacter shibae]URF52987.1 hypothetical protein M8007_19290 [Dinoroseobacter shibae]
MQAKMRNANTRSGFALIVVLSGLTVLTALFAVTSAIMMARLERSHSTAVLVGTNRLNHEALRLVLQGEVPDASAALLQLELGGATYQITLQDTGGLIDLNTAAPELIDMVADHLGLPEEALDRLRDWRRTPHRLIRTSDFLRVTDASPALNSKLEEIATVYSGRRGIAPDVAPQAVLELISDHGSSREAALEEIDGEFVSAPSGVNFRVVVQDSKTRAEWIAGTVHLPRTSDNRRVLWLR